MKISILERLITCSRMDIFLLLSCYLLRFFKYFVIIITTHKNIGMIIVLYMAAENHLEASGLCINESTNAATYNPTSNIIPIIANICLNFFIFIGHYYLLLLRFQICICSAFLISSSLKSGCATEIIDSHFCHVDNPLRLTLPYSVTR